MNIGLQTLNISSNTKLNRIKCGGNQLTALDVSKNVALGTLDCAGNQLSTLNLTKNTDLRILDCSNNQFASLDVSKNIKLTEILCSNNQLKTLDIRGLYDLYTLDVSSNNFPTQAAIVGLGVVDPANFTYDPQNPSGINVTAVFTDQNFLAAVREALGKAADAPVYDDECAWITVLDVSNRNIKNLDGIQYFTRLKDLNCSNNQLTSVEISACAALQYLDCYGNQLSALGVTRNTALEILSCGNNQITALDMSKNLELTDLYCANNYLTKLDLTKNTKFANIDIRYNYIQDEFGDLVFYDDYGLWLYEFAPQNSMGADISPVFPDQNFLSAVRAALGKGANDPIYTVDCLPVTLLNLSNKSIASLDGLAYFPNLSVLICSDNQLTALDISQNPKLGYLNCSNNLLTELDISQNSALATLDIRRNYLPSEEAVTGLNRDLTTTFSFVPQRVTGEDITAAFTDPVFRAAVQQQLAAALSKAPDDPIGAEDCAAIEQLNVSGLGIKSLDGIEYFTNLEVLLCSENLLTELDLSNSPALGALDCSDNLLSELDFSQNPAMTILLATYNCFSSEDKLIGLNKTALQLYEFAPQNEYSITPPDCAAQGFTTWASHHAPGETIVNDYTEALGHDYVPTVTPPTYTEDGYTTYICSRCGDSYTDHVVPKRTAPILSNISLEYKQSTDAFSKLDTPEITWNSSNTGVLSIDDNGSVSSVRGGTGETIITAYAEGKAIAQAKVTVEYNWWQWLIVILLFGWAWY